VDAEAQRVRKSDVARERHVADESIGDVMTEHGAGSSSLPEDVPPSPAEGAAIVQPSASYSIVMRVRLPQRPGSFAQVATVIGETGAILGAIDLVRVEKGMKIRDITVSCIDAAHGARSLLRLAGSRASRCSMCWTARSSCTWGARSR